ncbi:MAG: hypothetical protein OMM_08449 [Candidatus Magnetoglobus multicellularis str. Araruama]|uniref:Uncharacterized protein n=1 Tax=Candidatus Magnetoglobus multicellularis str. Araruama TaxID=890399 RepID=A0A1V1P8A7_9BACT|nr:MAG: hypothetical protein OMM_08449 [Candidatus Magnetoglobus multicellularis str. Araruama]
MNEDSSKQIYYSIEIETNTPDTEIWLGDDEGYFVQKEVGSFKSSLMAGNYTIEFGLGKTCYPITLQKDTKFTQSEIEAGSSCRRPTPKIEMDEDGDINNK